MPGQTVRETRNILVNSLSQKGFKAIRYKNGNMVNITAYSQMVARTTAVEALNTGRFNQLRTDNYDLVKMSEHFGACPICGPLQGRVYSISGNDNRYPSAI